MYKKEIGKRIKIEREKKHLSQIELGYELGQMQDNSAQGRVTKLENGTANLKTEELITLSKLFNVSTDYLLGITDRREEKTSLTMADVFQCLFELEKIGLTPSIEQHNDIVPNPITGEPYNETYEDVALHFNRVDIIKKLKEWTEIKNVCKGKEDEVYINLYESWRKGILSDKEILCSDTNDIDIELPF